MPGMRLVFFKYPPMGILTETILLGGTSITPFTFNTLCMDINCAVPKPRFAVFNCAAVKVTTSAISLSLSNSLELAAADSFLFPLQASNSIELARNINFLNFIKLSLVVCTYFFYFNSALI